MPKRTTLTIPSHLLDAAEDLVDGIRFRSVSQVVAVALDAFLRAEDAIEDDDDDDEPDVDDVDDDDDDEEEPFSDLEDGVEDDDDVDAEDDDEEDDDFDDDEEEEAA